MTPLTLRSLQTQGLADVVFSLQYSLECFLIYNKIYSLTEGEYLKIFIYYFHFSFYWLCVLYILLLFFLLLEI